MAKYFTRASGWVEDEIFSPESGPMPNISASGHEATDTGLLDIHGDTIMRAPNPMGFGKNEEW